MKRTTETSNQPSGAPWSDPRWLLIGLALLLFAAALAYDHLTGGGGVPAEATSLLP